MKAHPNLSLGSSGLSVVNREDGAFGAAALNHSLKTKHLFATKR